MMWLPVAVASGCLAFGAPWYLTSAALLWLVTAFIQRSAEKHRAYQATVAAFGWRDDIAPVEFENRCAEYLKMRGWKARTTKGSGDQGVDVLAEKSGVRVVLQCKRYNKPVGNKAVQEALAGKMFAQADRAAVVSNATFTPSAKQIARSTGVLLLHYTDLARADALFGVASARIPRTCPNCRAQLNLPSGRTGFVNCPTCGTRTRMRT